MKERRLRNKEAAEKSRNKKKEEFEKLQSVRQFGHLFSIGKGKKTDKPSMQTNKWERKRKGGGLSLIQSDAADDC